MKKLIILATMLATNISFASYKRRAQACSKAMPIITKSMQHQATLLTITKDFYMGTCKTQMMDCIKNNPYETKRITKRIHSEAEEIQKGTRQIREITSALRRGN